MDFLQTQARLNRAQQAALEGRIDETAPSSATASVEIKASPSTVWAVLADLPGWPRVLPGVSNVALNDPGRPLAPGAEFSWRSSRVGLHSVLQRVIPNEELTWTGRAFWLVAVHRNTIEPLSEDSCRFTSSESMTGPLANLLMPSTKLQAQLQGFANAIKGAAEECCLQLGEIYDEPKPSAIWR